MTSPINGSRPKTFLDYFKETHPDRRVIRQDGGMFIHDIDRNINEKMPTIFEQPIEHEEPKWSTVNQTLKD